MPHHSFIPRSEVKPHSEVLPGTQKQFRIIAVLQKDCLDVLPPAFLPPLFSERKKKANSFPLQFSVVEFNFGHFCPDGSWSLLVRIPCSHRKGEKGEGETRLSQNRVLTLQYSVISSQGVSHPEGINTI